MKILFSMNLSLPPPHQPVELGLLHWYFSFYSCACNMIIIVILFFLMNITLISAASFFCSFFTKLSLRTAVILLAARAELLYSKSSAFSCSSFVGPSRLLVEQEKEEEKKTYKDVQGCWYQCQASIPKRRKFTFKRFFLGNIIAACSHSAY